MTVLRSGAERKVYGMARRQQNGSAAALLSLLLTVALLVPFGFKGAAQASVPDQRGSATPAADSGPPAGKALFGARNKIQILIGRAGGVKPAVTPWALPGGPARPRLQFRGAGAAAQDNRAPNAPRVNSLGGRAPPHTSV
jgi:hypothetical protein